MEDQSVATTADDALEADTDETDLGDGAEKQKGNGFIDPNINL